MALRKIFLARAAMKELRTSLEVNPQNDGAAIDLILVHLRVPILGDGTRAASEIANELTGRQSSHAAFARGIIHFEEGRWDLAEKNLLEARKTMEDPRRVLFWLGYLYRQLQRWDDAFAVHEDLLRLSPNDPRAWYEVGRSADTSGLRVDWGETMIERYLKTVLPSGATPKDEARELLERLRSTQP